MAGWSRSVARREASTAVRDADLPGTLSKRRMYLVIVGLCVAAAWITVLFLMPGFGFDRISALALVILWAGLLVLLYRRAIDLHAFEIAFVVTLGYHFLSALTFALFVQGETYPYARFVTFAPLFYVWAFLALGSGTGLRVSALFYLLTVLLGSIRFGQGLFAPVDAGPASLQAIRLFYVSSVAYVSLLFAFAHYLDNHLRARGAAIEHFAFTDGLTGLANRRFLQERLHQQLNAPEPAPFSLFFIDLDRFKLVNDMLGHAAGDTLLQAVGARLRGRIRRSNVLARIGGDEFALLAPGVGDERTARTIAGEMLGAFGKPFKIAGRDQLIGVSIGISAYPRDGSTANNLLRKADQAMYSAKRKGRNQYRFYSLGLVQQEQRFAADFQIETHLRQALEQDQLEVHYQPIVDVDDSSISVVGAEALLRWRHPELGPIAPDVFVPVAEESGLILPIGRWVLEEACRQARAWSARVGSELAISVNVSPLQFAQDDFLGTVSEVLHATGLPATQLHLELTENVTVQASAERNIRELRALGVGVLLDDFGTGYSSLSKLHQLAISGFKIDRSFVHRIGSRDGDGAAMVHAVIALARSLDTALIAEGIESAAQQRTLLQLGCTTMQGDLFREAAPAANVESFLRGLRGEEAGGAGGPDRAADAALASRRWPR